MSDNVENDLDALAESLEASGELIPPVKRPRGRPRTKHLNLPTKAKYKVRAAKAAMPKPPTGHSPKQAIMAFRAKDGEKFAWYPQVGEPGRAYVFFKVFLDLGPTRSRQAVADIGEVEQSTVSDWGKKWNWDERAQRYDAHNLALEFTKRDAALAKNAEVWVARRDQIRETFYTNAEIVTKRAMEMVNWPLSEVTEHWEEEIVDEEGVRHVHHHVTHMPAKWASRDVAAFLKMAEHSQRLAAEMSTSSHTITVEEKRTDVTIKLVIAMVQKGLSLDEVRGRLIDMAVKPEDVDNAIETMRQGQEPVVKRITGERL